VLDVGLDAEVAHDAVLFPQPPVVVGLADYERAVLAHELRVELAREPDLQLCAGLLDPQQVQRDLPVEAPREIGVAAVVGREHHLRVVREHRPGRAGQVAAAAEADPLRLQHEEIVDAGPGKVQCRREAGEAATDDENLDVGVHA
jgi:hypothetical protein